MCKKDQRKCGRWVECQICIQNPNLVENIFKRKAISRKKVSDRN